MKPLHSSPYSFYFLALRYIGVWLDDQEGTEKDGSFKGNAYVLYRLIVTGVSVYSLYCLFLDLFTVMGDTRKMSWNLSVTVLFIGTTSKNVLMVFESERINSLRLMLHRDAESRSTPEDISIHEIALKEMKGVYFAFYSGALAIPVWIISRYIGRELPLPFALPGFIDLNNAYHFQFSFFFLGCIGAFFLSWTIAVELTTHSLLVQISREYRILLKDIHQIDLLYLDDGHDDCLSSVKNWQDLELHFRRKEVNPVLRKNRTKVLLNKLCERHVTLISYTQIFAQAFKRILFNEFFGLGFLVVVLGLQLLWDSFVLSGYLIYEIGYLLTSIVNMFMLCWWPTVIRNQCLDVGERLYSTHWYRMDIELQRDISMIIMRSQNPPKITAWNFLEMTLTSFMNTMRQIYSLLTFFRRLG